MATKWVDFKEVKGMATMAGVLEHYGIRFQHKTQIYLPCPLPSHTSKHSSNSLSVNLERNIWACKSESCIGGRNGKEGGNVLDFVICMEQCDVKTAAAKIVEWFGVKTETKSPMVISRPESEYNLVDWLEGTSNKNGSPKIEEPSGGANVAGHNNPSQQNNNPSPVKGKVSADVDKWFDALIVRKDKESDADFWQRVREAVKYKFFESYKNGKAART
jgi:hypothetical protein